MIFVVRRRGGFPRERIQLDIEDAFRNALMTGRSVRARVDDEGVATWRPPIEVYETADALVVVAEIAGLDEQQIEVVIDDATVSIRGERPSLCDDAARSIHELSIRYGAFAADVYLPFAVDGDRASARYDRGLLRVELPRQAGTRVQVGSERREN